MDRKIFHASSVQTGERILANVYWQTKVVDRETPKIIVPELVSCPRQIRLRRRMGMIFLQYIATLGMISIPMKKISLVFILLALAALPAYGATLSERLSGRILLQVEQQGRAWYVNPKTLKRHSLGRPADALQVMRQVGVGVSNSDFDRFNGKAPQRLAGLILLKVQDGGKAYYVHPQTLTLYSLGRPADALAVMRQVGLGIRDSDLSKIPSVVISRPEAGREIPGTVMPPVVEQPQPEPGESESFKFISVDSPVRRETQYDGVTANILSLDMRFSGQVNKKVEQQWYMHVTLDAETVDEKGNRPGFLNQKELLKIDNQFPYDLNSGSFSSCWIFPVCSCAHLPNSLGCLRLSSRELLLRGTPAGKLNTIIGCSVSKSWRMTPVWKWIF